MKKLFLLFLAATAFADQSVYISQQQLENAKSQAISDVNAASALSQNMTESVAISQQSLDKQKTVAQLAVQQAKGQSGSIQTSYESGEKYYIFSDQMKNDSIQIAREYKKSSPLNANDTITYYNQ
jgi:glucan-binding YG repeat protein